MDLPSIEIRQDSSSVNVVAHVTHGGNSPFFGKVTAAVKDKAGNNLYSEEQTIAVYRDNMLFKFSIPASRFPEGSYTADVKLTSERSDIPEDDLLKLQAVEKTVNFSVQ